MAARIWAFLEDDALVVGMEAAGVKDGAAEEAAGVVFSSGVMVLAYRVKAGTG